MSDERIQLIQPMRQVLELLLTLELTLVKVQFSDMVTVYADAKNVENGMYVRAGMVCKIDVE